MDARSSGWVELNRSHGPVVRLVKNLFLKTSGTVPGLCPGDVQRLVTQVTETLPLEPDGYEKNSTNVLPSSLGQRRLGFLWPASARSTGELRLSRS